jgi:hypothetical protein
MIVEKQMECRMAGETEVLGEILLQRHFCLSQNPTWPDPGLNPGRRGGKPAINRLSYGAAYASPCCRVIVNNKLEMMWKEAAVVYFKLLSQYLAGGIE